MIRRTLKGFLKLRRGIAEHLPDSSAHEVKLFITVLINADPIGSSRGILTASVAELVELSGMRRSTLIKTADKLVQRGWFKVVKARNQHEVTEWRVVKFDEPHEGEEEAEARPSAGHESATSNPHRAGSESDTTNSDLPVTEPLPAVNKSATSNPPKPLKPFDLQPPKNLKKNTTSSPVKRTTCQSSEEGIQPWTICEAIAEAGGLQFVKASGRDLREAKALKQAYPDITVETVKAVVRHLLTSDGGRFWNVQQPVGPAAIERHLPLWRKQQQAGPVSVPPIQMSWESTETYQRRIAGGIQ